MVSGVRAGADVTVQHIGGLGDVVDVPLVLLLPALLGGLAPGTVIGLLWGRRRLIVLPALLGLAWLWATVGSAHGHLGEGEALYYLLAEPVFWGSIALNFGGFVLAYVLVRRWRNGRVGC
jgi:hypothetical protein